MTLKRFSNNLTEMKAVTKAKTITNSPVDFPVGIDCERQKSPAHALYLRGNDNTREENESKKKKKNSKRNPCSESKRDEIIRARKKTTKRRKKKAKRSDHVRMFVDSFSSAFAIVRVTDVLLNRHT